MESTPTSNNAPAFDVQDNASLATKLMGDAFVANVMDAMQHTYYALDIQNSFHEHAAWLGSPDSNKVVATSAVVLRQRYLNCANSILKELGWPQVAPL